MAKGREKVDNQRKAKGQKQKVTRRTDGTFAPGVVQEGATLWMPGESGNPAGRPRDFATEFKEYTGQGREFAMKKAKQCAANGDWRAVQYLLDRFYGKMADKIEHTVRQEIEMTYALEIRQAISLESDNPELADRVMKRLAAGG